MTLQDWVIKELRGIIAVMNENTIKNDANVLEANRRLTSLEDRIKHLERIMMGSGGK